MTSRIGVWFVGARGSVAVTSIVGALAVRAGLVDRTGLVSELPEVAAARLPAVGDLVVGGHDVTTHPLGKRAEALVHSGVLPAHLVGAVGVDLDEVDGRLRHGVLAEDAPQRDVAARLERDIRAFREDNHLDQVVVVDVSSTEPPVGQTPVLATLTALEAALDAGESPLPTSSLYAYAAFRTGCPVVAFTPSPGPTPPALTELAHAVGVPWAGCDGKTGETLVKSALAPMFATRALRVRSWASTNLLGGGDGQTLADPAAAASKISTKAQGLQAMLGHPVDGPLHIDYVEDLGDWKTAWDHISFEGFLGVRMSLQFTWAGCDSALAAPLVLDLVRLVARAQQAGLTGALPALGFFFKSPVGSDEHRLAAQWEALVGLCAQLGADG
ncbi:MAG TPA: inositol-3-phosphate synthase [Nocardioidaceae bacterium]